jgi:REP element-mobilizing transposase RayT
MANTYTSLHYHLIFSTKNRTHWLGLEIEQRVWEYLGGIARRHKLTALQIGGTADHIHACVFAPASFAPSQIAQFLKGDSSKWVHGEFRALRDFAWQDGYGAFSVSKSNLPEVIHYIQNQHKHHQEKTFQEEYMEFLHTHGIQYDERYLWD